MHAAPSVILFTVFSGAGFGYLAFLGLGFSEATGWAAFFRFALAYALAVGGLMASTFHLGHPERSLLAFTQWRSSWLSREAWASVAALLTLGLFAVAAIFLAEPLPYLGALGATLALLTVFATSMIYAQLKTVPRWNSPLTPLYYLACALAGGAILAGDAPLAVVFLLLLGAVQLAAWAAGDGRFSARGHSIESATGLGALGKVRHFEGPHTGSNYLLNEFVHEIGRKHAQKLRAMTILAMCLVPAALLLLLPATVATFAAAFAVHLIGAFVSRWLFFAEAEHLVRLYYGKA